MTENISLRRWRLATSLALSSSLLVGVPAFAQDSAAGQNATPADQNAAPAQSADAAPSAAAPSDTGGLGEVVVTAERRAEDVQSLPIVVQAISGAALLENHIVATQDLASVAPGFTDNQVSGGLIQATNIRGIGQTALTAPNVPPGVANFRDGLLQGELAGLDVPFFDTADIEVLEGPQGTLGGGSSVGGSVQVNSQNPNFRGLNGYVDSQIGNFNEKKVDGAVNLTVSDTFAVRVAFNQESRNSFYRDAGAEDTIQDTNVSVMPLTDPGSLDNNDMRIGLLWKPTDKFQALVKFEYNVLNYGGEAAEPSPYTYTSLFSPTSCSGGGTLPVTCGAPGTGTTVHSNFYYPGEQPLTLDYYNENGANNTETYETHESKYLADLRYTLPGDIELRSLTGFQNLDTDLIFWQSYGPLNDGVNLHILGPWDNYYSEEINLISPTTGKINWIAGAFWFYRDTPVEVDTPVFNAPLQNANLPQTSCAGTPASNCTSGPAANNYPATETFTDPGAEVRMASLFANVNWQLTNTLQLGAGIRENWDANFNWNSPYAGSYTYGYGPGQPNYNPAVTGNPLPCNNVAAGQSGKTACQYAYGHYTDHVPTGKVNLSWTPAQGQNFYAFYARGYKAGGSQTNPNPPIPQTFYKPETVNDWELGWKGSLLNNHIVTQVGGYYMRYQNMDYPIFDIYAPSVGTGMVANLPPSTIEGISLALQSRFLGFDFDLTGDWNQSKLGTLHALNSQALPGGTAYNFTLATAPVQCNATPQAGCFNYLPYEQTVGNEPNAMSPKWTGNATLDYGIPVGSHILRPRVKVSYQSSEYSSIFENFYNYIPPYGLVSANIDYEAGSWLLSLYGTNLGNKLYIPSKDANLIYYGAPRQYGVRFQYTFSGPQGG